MSVRQLFLGLAALVALSLGQPSAALAQADAPASAPAAPAAPPSAAAADVDTGYILGPEDVVEVDALGHTDFQSRVRVSQDGTIQLPYLGVVPASNRTVGDLGAQVAKALEAGGYFSKPIVKVEVVSFASRNVTVLGQVGTPGVVPVGRAYRLSEILARVGGVREDGADFVIVRPVKGDAKQYIIKDLATGDSSADPFVAAGDKIFVPKAEMFYISGQVKAPGTYPLVTGMTLRMALARGGGVTELGSDRGVKITRAGKVQHVDLDGKIAAGDVIVVGEKLF